jgi:phosphoesterase RecJ-like protein
MRNASSGCSPKPKAGLAKGTKVKERTKAAIGRLATRLAGEPRIVLASHVDPDGDAIGSLCGLSLALSRAGREVYTALSDDGPGPTTYRDVPGFDLLAPASEAPSWPVLVALDVPVVGRLGDMEAAAGRAALTVRIDHHPGGSAMSDLDVADEEAPATAYLVWGLIRAMDLPLDADVAEALYVGLVTDTGRFQYSNVTPETFSMAGDLVRLGVRPEKVFRYVYDRRRLAALRLVALVIERTALEMDGKLAWAALSDEDVAAVGGVPEETENLIDELRSIEGIEVACLMKERPDGIRGSLRSKGRVDVGAIAAELGGGGHREASGFPFDGTPEEAVAAVKALVARQLGQRE